MDYNAGKTYFPYAKFMVNSHKGISKTRHEGELRDSHEGGPLRFRNSLTGVYLRKSKVKKNGGPKAAVR